MAKTTFFIILAIAFLATFVAADKIIIRTFSSPFPSSYTTLSNFELNSFTGSSTSRSGYEFSSLFSSSSSSATTLSVGAVGIIALAALL